jgi:hypothetical protein
VLLIGTALLYLWGLGASGYANEYYAAAVQAASLELDAAVPSARCLAFATTESVRRL